MPRFGIRFAFKRRLPRVYAATKLSLVLALILSFFSISCGVINGTLLSFWLPVQTDQHNHALLADLTSRTQNFGFSGFTLRDFQNTRNDFHTRRLNTFDWVQELGFIHPDEYRFEKQGEDSMVGIDNYGDFESLMYDESRYFMNGQKLPKEQWVFLSDYGWPTISSWDRAFDEAVQVGYRHPVLNQTRLFFMECQRTGKFLCGVWHLRAPTLLHFRIGDDFVQKGDIDSDLTYTSRNAMKLRPVTVRAIEFPLKDAYTGLPSTVFPDYKTQLLSIMTGERLYEQVDAHDTEDQMLKRFYEYTDLSFYENTKHFLYYFGNLENWWTKHIIGGLGLTQVDEIVHAATFGLTYIAWFLVLRPYYFVKDTIFFGFLGARPTGVGEEDDFMGDFLAQMDPGKPTFWRGMLEAFWANMTEEKKIEDKKIFENEGTTRPPLPKWTDIAGRFEGIIPGGRA